MLPACDLSRSLHTDASWQHALRRRRFYKSSTWIILIQLLGVGVSGRMFNPPLPVAANDRCEIRISRAPSKQALRFRSVGNKLRGISRPRRFYLNLYRLPCNFSRGLDKLQNRVAATASQIEEVG